MHYYDHHIGDFRAATAFLPDNLQYAYLKLLWVYYDTEEPLPNDPVTLSLKAGVSQDQVLIIMAEFFDLEQDQWHHARCDELIAKYQGHKEASSRGGKKRAANAAKRQGGLKAPSATAQPTNNQEPITSNQKKKNSRFAPPSHEDLMDYVNEKSLLVNIGQFMDHYTSNGWKVGRNPMKDWRAAARNWSKREEEKNATNQRSTTGKPESNHARVSRKLQEDLKDLTG